jgi:hypothetical protein
MSRRTTAVTAIVFLALICTSSASELEDRLHGRLRGAWSVLGVEVYSNCSGTYNDNTVQTGRVASKADRRFEAGELVKIDKIKVKRERVDVLVRFAEPVLRRRTDGPFELYDEAACKAQLLIPVPREIVKGKDEARLVEIITGFVTPFTSLDEARLSDSWNGRQRQPYPGDYELTLARYEVWKAEQTNAAVASRRERAIEDAADLVDDLDDDGEYLEGFAAGAEALKNWSVSDCTTLVNARFSYYDKSPPSDKSETRWREGFEDGQELAFNVLLIERLGRCSVPIPPRPPEE